MELARHSLQRSLGLKLEVIAFAGLLPLMASRAANFTARAAQAQRLGTHEIVIQGNGDAANAFDAVAQVTFTPPSGAAKAVTVDAFYDGALSGGRGSMLQRRDAGRGIHAARPMRDSMERHANSLRTNTMGYMLARWGGAFPNAFWLIVDDMHCDEKFPKNQAFVREIGRYFAHFFRERKIDLALFRPNDQRVADVYGRSGKMHPKLMENGTTDFIIYHPNTAVDGHNAVADDSKTARLRLDLVDAARAYQLEWYRALDGVSQRSQDITKGHAIHRRQHQRTHLENRQMNAPSHPLRSLTAACLLTASASHAAGHLETHRRGWRRRGRAAGNASGRFRVRRQRGRRAWAFPASERPALLVSRTKRPRSESEGRHAGAAKELVALLGDKDAKVAPAAGNALASIASAETVPD